MEKNINILTIHKEPNYGAVLQAYALYKTIENLGHVPYIINLDMDYRRFPYNLKYRVLFGLHKWMKGYSYCFALAERFSRKHCPNQIGNFHTTAELESYPWNKDDYYLIGSDQVWNTVGTGVIDPAYFLSFVPDDKKKIAYAGCFGTKTVRDEDRDNIIKWLKRYDHITIREKSGVELAKSLGVDAEQVLDPTFLMTPQNWLDTLPKKEKKESYVLVYQLHPNKEFQTYAKEFAKRKNMKLIRVNPYFHHMFKPGKFVFCPPVEEFLWYIKNADYFLTDSFHGTSFAIGLNTQFVDVLPNVYSERNRSILATAGLEDRILMSYDDFKIADTPIDFTAVNQKINAERTRSAEILKKIIEE